MGTLLGKLANWRVIASLLIAAVVFLASTTLMVVGQNRGAENQPDYQTSEPSR